MIRNNIQRLLVLESIVEGGIRVHACVEWDVEKEEE